MSNQTKQEFLDSFPESNEEWAAQQIINEFSDQQLMELDACFAKLNDVLYKSWGKEMPFSELHVAVKLAKRLSQP